VRRPLALLAIMVFLLTLAAPAVLPAYAQTEVYVQKIRIIRITEDSPAIQSLEQGKTQARLFGIRSPELAAKLAAEGFQVIAPLSGLDDILVNPVKCKNGQFNPFTLHDVRYALNFLIDRAEVASKIFKGRAVPAIIPYADVDPDYVMLLPVAAKYEVLFSKGFDYAKKLIDEAMTKAGAKLVNGKWYYHGKPVVIKIVIRIEDERKQLGEYLANKLEQLGFTVEKLYKDFRGAFNIVYGDDPGKCGWNLYTEGWGFTGMTKYDHDTAVAFYSSLYGFQPGWGEPSYTNYKPPKIIDEIAEKLVKGEYKNAKEYWQLYRKLVDLGVYDSMRVFVVWTMDYYIAAPNLKGIIESPKATPWNTWTYFTLKYTRPDVVFSNRYVYASGWPWNPIGGFQDFYSAAVRDAVYLPGITSKITTGQPGWSVVANWKVVRGPVKVPSSAITWDTKKHEWVSAGGEVAKNEVIINYKVLGKLRFHDGSKETLADILAGIYMIKEWATKGGPNDKRYESQLASLYAPFLSSFVAVRIINSTTIAVYTNFTHIDDGVIAMNADVWTGTPLELYLAMEKLVLSGSAVFTMSASKASGKPAVHLISKDQCSKMKQLLEQILSTGKMPDWVQGLIKLGLLTKQEFIQRIKNLINYYDEYGNMLVGNGPFMLVKYDAANDAATLVRVKDYPIPPELIAKELSKHVASIPSLQAQPLVMASPGAKVATINVLVDKKPATSKTAHVYAMLISGKGEVYQLDVKCVTPGVFEAYIPSQAPPAGSYTIVVYVYPVGYNEPAKAMTSVVLVPPTKTTTTTTTTTTTMTTSPTAAKTVTVYKTVTVTSTQTVTKTAAGAAKTVTMTSTVTKTVTGPGIITAIIAVIAFVVGLGIGAAISRRRPAAAAGQ